MKRWWAGRGPRRAPWALGAACLAAFAGCQSYKARPLDLPAHRAVFLARSADSAPVRHFAASLHPDDHPEGHAAPFDLADGVSIAEAEVIALVYNADLHAARQRALLCLACAGAAGAWEDPVFGLDLARIVESVDEPWKLGGSIGISVPISGRLRLDKLHAEAEQAAEVMRAVQLEWRTRMDLRRAWSRWSSLAERCRVAADDLRRLDELLTVVDLQQRAQAIPRVEANVFRLERTTLAMEHEQMQAQQRLAGLRIRRLMGLPPGAELAMTPWGVEEDRPAVMSADQLNDQINHQLQDRIASNNPEVAAMAAGYAQAERLLEWEVRKQYPDIELAPGLGEDDGRGEVRLGLSLRLPILNANKRAIAEAQTARDAMRLDVEALVERLISDLAAAEVVFESARRQRETVETQLVPMVDEQAAMVRRIIELGEGDTLIMLESLRRERSVRQQLIESRERVALAAIDIAELAGPDLLSLSGPQGSRTSPSGSAANDPLMKQAAAEAGCTCPDCLAKAAAAITARGETKVPENTGTQHKKNGEQP
ncbi:MAG TPA: TolC family protein [Phycisphaerales bacterium]|nr:TolC family protein [Phycisphaerales bacterium]